MDLLGYLDSIVLLDAVTLLTVFWIAIIATVSLTLERLIVRHIRKLAKKAKLKPNVTNGVVLSFRLMILVGALASVTRLGGLPTEWFLAFSVLGGAAIGFGSQQTIGNFIAGLHLLAARPFRAGDLVRIGTVEGVVQEVTINYTKVLTMGNNLVSISNLNVLQRDITNFLYENDEPHELHCCAFEIVFDHSLSATRTAKLFEVVFDECGSGLPRRPVYRMLRSGAFERVYMVYLYVKYPEDVFTLRPKVPEEMFKRMDRERPKKN